MEEAPKARKKEIMRVTLLGSFANFVLLVFKFVAGIWGHSSAMIADAVHSLSDFVTDIIVLLFVNISSKPKDESHDYGHGKYETLATSIVGIVLLCVGRKQNSQVVIANAWHHRSDAFSSIGTALGIGGAILLGDNWRVLDPLAAVIVSLFIVKVALQLVIPAINDLLEKSLPKEVEDEILAIISEVPEVKSPHNLRTRRIGNNFAIEAHIRVNGQITVTRAHDLTKEIEQNLRDKFGQATHIALHVEPIK